MYLPGTQPDILGGRGGFVKLGHFDKHSIKNTIIKTPAGKIFGVFSPRYSKNYILNGKFNPKIDTIRALFSILKKGAGEALSPLVAHLLADIREKELFGINCVKYKKKHFRNTDLEYRK